MRETARYVDAVHLACPPVECQNVRDCQGLVLFNSVQFGYFLVGGVWFEDATGVTSDGDNSTTTSSALHNRVTEDGRAWYGAVAITNCQAWVTIVASRNT